MSTTQHLIASQLAKLLLEKGAVVFSPEQPFTYASGKVGPIYCDNRLLLAHPQALAQIGQWLGDSIKKNYPSAQAIIGVATAGIAHATAAALHLQWPMGYVRAQAKAHGKKNQVEGFATAHAKVVVVEDLLNSGMSSLAAVNALQASQLEVLALACLVDYEFASAHSSFHQQGVGLLALTTFSELLNVAQQLGKLKTEDRTILLRWHDDPDHWTGK